MYELACLGASRNNGTCLFDRLRSRQASRVRTREHQGRKGLTMEIMKRVLYPLAIGGLFAMAVTFVLVFYVVTFVEYVLAKVEN